MMDLIRALIPEVPGLAGTIMIVVLFLIYLERADRSRNKTLQSMHDRCHEIQTRAVTALNRNTIAFGRVDRAIEFCEKKVLPP